MTNPSEVVVSDADVDFIVEEIANAMYGGAETSTEAWKKALAMFLAKRVPDAPPQDDADCGECAGVWHDGFNACRECVLQGEP